MYAQVSKKCRRFYMTKFLFLCLFIYTSLTAAELEEFPFVGLTVATRSLDLPKVSNADDPSEASIGVRWGKQSVDWRTLFTFEYTDSGYTSLSMEIDRILMDNILGYSELRPYVGANLGMISYAGKNTEDGSENGFYWGATAGVLVYVTDNIDADISFHHYNIENLDTVDHIQGASIAVHYFY
jgi:hypothetical protein